MVLSKNGLSKRCAKCRLWKTIDNYDKRTASKDGLKPRCKKCIRTVRRISNKSKHCPKCNQTKNKETGFHKSKAQLDGYSHYCADCMRKATAKYRPTHECTECDIPYSINIEPKHPLYCKLCFERRKL